MAEQTLFERILSGEIPSHEIGSGDGWYAFLDIFPRREGHTLVIPNCSSATNCRSKRRPTYHVDERCC